MSNTFFVTTAIDYVNSMPHLGTAYEKIGADVLARFQRLFGKDTFFLMGTDEHSINVERQARAQGLGPQEYCDRMAEKFQEVWSLLEISYDDFLRTSQPRHHAAVAQMFRKIMAAGDIYKGKYRGWYCVSCEAFLTDKDLVEGTCPVHRIKPQWIEENNYFFRLSKYQHDLLDHYEKNPQFVCPSIRHNEIVNVVKEGLQDISISRSSLGWGIPVPDDSSQVVYVWFDALVNYLTGAGYPAPAIPAEQGGRRWPADVHVIGKDITRFHCVIWPAMLMSAGLPLPRKVFGHGFVYIKGAKMSKTEGRSVDPVEAAKRFGPDALRYYLMREIPFDRDGDFAWENFQTRYTSDLANDLGNLVSRVLSMIQRYCQGRVPQADGQPDTDLLQTTSALIGRLPQLVDELDFSGILTQTWSVVQLANRKVEEAAPWNLAKAPAQHGRLFRTLYDLAETLRILAVVIGPFMPSISSRIFQQLGMSLDKAQDRPPLQPQIPRDTKWGLLKSGQNLGQLAPLFPKEVADIA